MPLNATPARRKLVVIVLLVLALAGAAVRHWAPNPSTLRDLGSLMLVLWVPVIGNVIAYFGRKIKLGRKSPFGGRPFAGELLVEMTPLAPAPALGKPLDGDTCALVVGTEAFSARLSQPLAGWLASDAPIRVQAQFLKPKIALARFPQDTSFRVVAQERLVGQGRVLQVLSQAAVERRTGTDDARGAG
jgi:hypothetical protein